MDLSGKTAVVTGGGQGIGRAICRAFAAEGMRVVVADIDPVPAQKLAEEIGGHAVACDLCDADAVGALAAEAEAVFGPVALWCSNAGFARGDGETAVSSPDATWQAGWDLHVMAHVRAARAVLPGMIARGEGVLVNVASAAGLLSQIGDAAYSATKHAAVSLAQSLAISHGEQGIQVAVVCPQYVATPLLGYTDEAAADLPHDRVLRPEAVAEALLQGLRDKRFLILPHPEVARFAQARAQDMDAWIRGMQALRRRVLAELPEGAGLTDLHRLI